MAITCLELGEKLEQKRIPDVSKHLPALHRLQAATWPRIPE